MGAYILAKRQDIFKGNDSNMRLPRPAQLCGVYSRLHRIDRKGDFKILGTPRGPQGGGLFNQTTKVGRLEKIEGYALITEPNKQWNNCLRFLYHFSHL